MDELNRLSLTDEYMMKDRITPSPKGFVVIRDENGNIIFRGNNMVVKSGRSLLFDLFANNGSIKFSSLKAFIGNNSTMVGATNTFSSSVNDTHSTYKKITTMQSGVNFNNVQLYKKDTSDSTTYIKVSSPSHDDFMVYYTFSKENNSTPEEGVDYYTQSSESYSLAGKFTYRPVENLNKFETDVTYYIKNENIYTTVNTTNNTTPDPNTIYYLRVGTLTEFAIDTTYYTKSLFCSESNTLYYYIDSSNLLIHMGIYYTPESDSNSYSTFGLFYGSEDHEQLFSRIVFPKRTLTPDTPVIIDYYLYF